MEMFIDVFMDGRLSEAAATITKPCHITKPQLFAGVYIGWH